MMILKSKRESRQLADTEFARVWIDDPVDRISYQRTANLKAVNVCPRLPPCRRRSAAAGLIDGNLRGPVIAINRIDRMGQRKFERRNVLKELIGLMNHLDRELIPVCANRPTAERGRTGLARALLRAGLIYRAGATAFLHLWKVRRSHPPLRTQREFSALHELVAPLGKMRHQPPSPLLQYVLVLRLRGEVVDLLRIFLEIEKLLFPVSRVEDIFPPRVRQRIPMVRRTVTDVVFKVDPLAPTAPFVTNQRQQTASIDRTAWRRARCFEERRENIA